MNNIAFLFLVILSCYAITSVVCKDEPNTTICIRQITQTEATPQRMIVPSIDARGDVRFVDMLDRSTVFVDKSLLIKRILEIKEKIVMITCPPKWGKSINLSMLKAFFEIRINENTKKMLSPTETSTYEFFTKGKFSKKLDDPFQVEYVATRICDEGNASIIYCNPPLIAKHPDMIDKHLGQYVIIYLNFTVPDRIDAPTITKFLRQRIAITFIQHKFLKEMLKDEARKNHSNDKDREEAENNFKKFETYEKLLTFHNEYFSYVDVENSFLFLSRIINQLLGKEVIILIDDYVQILQTYLFTSEFVMPESKKRYKDEIEKGLKLLKNFIRITFKDNPYLKKAVLTGVLSVCQDELFANISDLVHYNAVDNDLQEFYGITEKELSMLFEYFKVPTKLAEEARNFYGGYTMKRNSNLVIYNAWSIVNFLNENMIRDYWEQSTKMLESVERWFYLKRIYVRKDVLPAIVHGKEVRIRFKKLSFEEKVLLYHTWYETFKFNDDAKDVIFSCLCDFGILTLDNRFHSDDNTDIVCANVSLRLPNKNVKQELLRRTVVD